MTASPLVSLAWNALPEHVIVARVAHSLSPCVRHHRRRQPQGLSIDTIKEAVRKTEPPHGILGKRVAAVQEELARQDAIRAKRRAEAPFVWQRPELGERRRRVASSQLNMDISECRDVRVTRGHAIYLVRRYERYSNRTFIVVLHRLSGQTSAVLVPQGDGATTLAEAVIALHSHEISRVLQHGGFFSIDVCRLATTLHPLNEPSVDLFWATENEAQPLERPRRPQCENWG